MQNNTLIVLPPVAILILANAFFTWQNNSAMNYRLDRVERDVQHVQESVYKK